MVRRVRWHRDGRGYTAGALPSKRAIIDLTQKAAEQLNMLNAGRTRVTVRVLSKEQAQALRDAAKDAPLALSAATELLANALSEDSR